MTQIGRKPPRDAAAHWLKYAAKYVREMRSDSDKGKADVALQYAKLAVLELELIVQRPESKWEP